MRKKPENSYCELCQRDAPLTFHHLIPRKVHRRARFQKHYTLEQLQQGVWLCYPCHRAVHRRHDEMELALRFNSLEALKSDPDMASHIVWIRKQKVLSL